MPDDDVERRPQPLDDLIHDAIIVLVAQLIGVAPGQFIAVVAFTQLTEPSTPTCACPSAAWASVWVDQPAFPPGAPCHRHRSRVGRPWTLGDGRNFMSCCSWWDMLFRSAT